MLPPYAHYSVYHYQNYAVLYSIRLGPCDRNTVDNYNEYTGNLAIQKIETKSSQLVAMGPN